MDKELLQWLNASQKNYKQGVTILHRLGKDAKLNSVLLNEGESKSNSERLFEALRQIFYELKGIKPTVAIAPTPTAPTPPPTPVEPVAKNPELEKATKSEAEKLYKQLANTRAVLFALCPKEKHPNENNAEAVKQREGLALDILEMQTEVDIAYNRHRYVCEHGKLPEQVSDADQPEELPTNPILLERKRVNLIKSINKLKAKEATPERVALIQQLNSTLKIVTDGVDQFLKEN
jgi:hypothetical protein